MTKEELNQNIEESSKKDLTQEKIECVQGGYRHGEVLVVQGCEQYQEILQQQQVPFNSL